MAKTLPLTYLTDRIFEKTFMKAVIQKAVLLAVFTFIVTAAKANDFYVDFATGDNSSSRTGQDSALPWKTIPYALSRISGQGHTIHVASGTYPLDSQLLLPAGISLAGAGNTTVFKLNSNLHLQPNDGLSHINNVMMRLEVGNNTGIQTLRDFKIDGENKHLWGGIYINARSNMDIYNITVVNTYFTGIWLTDMTNSSLHHSYFENCAWGRSDNNVNYQSGAVQLGNNLQNINLYNLIVKEGTPGQPLYGYGMKVMGTSNGNIMDGVRVYNSEFTCNPLGIWDGGRAPNIAVEWHSVKVKNCELHHNTFNNNVSLVNDINPNTGSEVSVKVYGNKFIKPSGTGSDGYYALELLENNAEIAGNHFDGGIWPIALWQRRSASGWNIHHNTFTNIRGVSWLGGVYVLVDSASTLNDVKFWNNTCYINQSDFAFAFLAFKQNSSITNAAVRNNIFTKAVTGGSTPIVLATMNGGNVSNAMATFNCLHNVSAGSEADLASDNIPSPPLLVANGDMPEPFFHLQTGSPCINAGTKVDPLDPDEHPDMGAYEFEGTPGGPLADTLDFGAQASGIDMMDDSFYTDVAGVAVNFDDNIQHYDGSMWMGGPDHTPNNRMAFFPDATASSVTFSHQVQVPSLWINMLVYGSFGGVVTGKLNGSQVWTKSIPGSSYGSWYAVTTGAGLEINELTFTGVQNYGLDDITIVNTNPGAAGGRISKGEALNVPAASGVETLNNELNVYPNPVRAGQTVQLILPGTGSVKLIDSNGRILKQADIIGGQQAEMSTDGLSGLYLLKVYSRNGTRSVKIVVH